MPRLRTTATARTRATASAPHRRPHPCPLRHAMCARAPATARARAAPAPAPAPTATRRVRARTRNRNRVRAPAPAPTVTCCARAAPAPAPAATHSATAPARAPVPAPAATHPARASIRSPPHAAPAPASATAPVLAPAPVPLPFPTPRGGLVSVPLPCIVCARSPVPLLLATPRAAALHRVRTLTRAAAIGDAPCRRTLPWDFEICSIPVLFVYTGVDRRRGLAGIDSDSDSVEEDSIAQLAYLASPILSQPLPTENDTISTLYDAYLHSPLQRTLSSDSEVKVVDTISNFSQAEATFHPLCSRRTRLLQGPSPPALTSSRLPYAFAAVPDVYREREGFTLSFNAVVLMRPSCAVPVDIPAPGEPDSRANYRRNLTMLDDDGREMPGTKGYKYFDRAKELPACARRCRRRLCPLHVAAAARALCTPPSPPVPSAAALHAAICLYATAAHCHPRLCTSPSARHHHRVYAPRAFCMHPVPSACASPLHAPCRCRLCPLHVAPTALALCMPPSPPVPSDAARRHLSVHRRRPLHATTALCTQHARVATRHHRRLCSLYTQVPVFDYLRVLFTLPTGIQDLSAVVVVSLY
ncbi:hypothetical protein GGX14DRAFT_635455 [Mycena pura]|uniref:Uncharacterized protein n=1 Tax=Mycena pura TaxID=153505 RepID=A0AAD6VBM7_9AGAR|nr:hypothetical protein GGX14DRAFT_635455 [Mycena pura]